MAEFADMPSSAQQVLLLGKTMSANSLRAVGRDRKPSMEAVSQPLAPMTNA